jgi:uncharacterized 2Fe-2S/4Fe-4S cluster protein (DUF4445 family)
MEKVSVDFEPIGRRISLQRGANLLAAAQEAGVRLVSICGGIGSCGECVVRLEKGQLSPPTIVEADLLTQSRLAAGYRLACQAQALSDVKLDIPPESLTAPQRLQIEGQTNEAELQPAVLAVEVELERPDIGDPRADSMRILDALRNRGYQNVQLPLAVMQDFSNRMRAQGWVARIAMRGAEVAGVLPIGSPILGLAVDIGTTKMAAYLVDLSTGKTLSKRGEMNPQTGYGEDVISRIEYANRNPEGRAILQSKVVQTINWMAEELCREVGESPGQIVDSVFVGNTVMHHLFCGLPVQQLGVSPYVPAVTESLEIAAHQIGLEFAPAANAYLPPNIAGYVGADHVAMLLATEIWETDKVVVAIDIGTNTEITLAAGGRMLSCSCASGPAFEGAHIRDGMRAAPGAIERIQIRDSQDIFLQTIDNQPPVGLCGSGILDAVAELLNGQIIDSSGRFIHGHPLVRLNENEGGIVLVQAPETGHGRDISVTHKDVNEIQLAKAAIRAGLEILLLEAGLTHEDIDEIVVAGALGSYLSVGSAKRIGMFPPIPDDLYRQVGNAAGMGAKQMLVSTHRREVAEEMSRRIEYIELTAHGEFTKAFMQAMYL